MHQKIERGALDARLTKRERAARDKASQRLAMRTYFRKQAAATLGDRHWWLVKHSERNGESLAQAMRDEGIEAWCAVSKERKRVGRGNATVEKDEQIFPNYLFVRTVPFEAAWLGVMTFEGVTGFVLGGEKPLRIRQRTIDEVLAFLSVLPSRRQVLFAPDAMVQVMKGSFSGFEGKVKKSEDKRGDVIVEVDMFGRVTICNFGIDSLRLLD